MFSSLLYHKSYFLSRLLARAVFPFLIQKAPNKKASGFSLVIIQIIGSINLILSLVVCQFWYCKLVPSFCLLLKLILSGCRCQLIFWSGMKDSLGSHATSGQVLTSLGLLVFAFWHSSAAYHILFLVALMLSMSTEIFLVELNFQFGLKVHLGLVCWWAVGLYRPSSYIMCLLSKLYLCFLGE